MKSSFLTYFGATFFLHVLLLMIGAWQVTQSETFKKNTEVQKLGGGGGAIQLQVATKVVLSSVPQVQKKIANNVPVNPKKPTIKVAEEKSSPAPSTSQTASAGGQGDSKVPGFGNKEGSEFGTARVGLTDKLSVYKAELRAMIEKNKYYPSMSKRLGHEGTVVVAFTLLEDGHIIDVRIEKPSRYEPLNSSAMDAVKKVERFKPIPKEVGETTMAIKVPVKFVTI